MAAYLWFYFYRSCTLVHGCLSLWFMHANDDLCKYQIQIYNIHVVFVYQYECNAIAWRYMVWILSYARGCTFIFLIFLVYGLHIVGGIHYDSHPLTNPHILRHMPMFEWPLVISSSIARAVHLHAWCFAIQWIIQTISPHLLTVGPGPSPFCLQFPMSILGSSALWLFIIHACYPFSHLSCVLLHCRQNTLWHSSPPNSHILRHVPIFDGPSIISSSLARAVHLRAWLCNP